MKKIYIFTLLLAFSLGGCLRTRTQVKGGGESTEQESSESAEAPAQSGGYHVEELRGEVAKLAGKVDELDNRNQAANTAELKEYAARIDGRVAELEKNQVLMMSEIKELKDRKGGGSSAATSSHERESGDPLAEAKAALQEKDYEGAAEKYRAIISKGVKGNTSAEAHFGLGEAEYGLKNYKKAIVAYSKVQEANSKSAQVPASLYKIGLSFQNLNMNKEAKGFFSELLERYPTSKEAKKARAKVKE